MFFIARNVLYCHYVYAAISVTDEALNLLAAICAEQPACHRQALPYTLDIQQLEQEGRLLILTSSCRIKKALSVQLRAFFYLSAIFVIAFY